MAKTTTTQYTTQQLNAIDWSSDNRPVIDTQAKRDAAFRWHKQKVQLEIWEAYRHTQVTNNYNYTTRTYDPPIPPKDPDGKEYYAKYGTPEYPGLDPRGYVTPPYHLVDSFFNHVIFEALQAEYLIHGTRATNKSNRIKQQDIRTTTMFNATHIKWANYANLQPQAQQQLKLMYFRNLKPMVPLAATSCICAKHSWTMHVEGAGSVSTVAKLVNRKPITDKREIMNVGPICLRCHPPTQIFPLNTSIYKIIDRVICNTKSNKKVA